MSTQASSSTLAMTSCMFLWSRMVIDQPTLCVLRLSMSRQGQNPEPARTVSEPVAAVRSRLARVRRRTGLHPDFCMLILFSSEQRALYRSRHESLAAGDSRALWCNRNQQCLWLRREHHRSSNPDQPPVDHFQVPGLLPKPLQGSMQTWRRVGEPDQT